MWKWQESGLGFLLGSQLWYFLGHFLLLIHRVPESINIFMEFFRALFNKMFSSRNYVRSTESKLTGWHQTKV